MYKIIDCIAQSGVRSLLYEVLISPKPGLVDRFNNGSHHDMDMFTFIDAISALTPYFKKYLEVGVSHDGSPKELFQKSREVGYDAEMAMMEATNYINTHKGANFTFALVLCATGYLLKENKVAIPFREEDTICLFDYVSLMSKGLVSHDFSSLDKKEKLSYGEKLYLQYGISGIRGVAEEGYPVITQYVMPYLRNNLVSNHIHFEKIFLHALSLIMSEVEDTNLIHRGGMASYNEIKNRAKEIYLSNTPQTITESFHTLDKELIDKHLSPGGAADLLSLSIFIANLEGLI